MDSRDAADEDGTDAPVNLDDPSTWSDPDNFDAVFGSGAEPIIRRKRSPLARIVTFAGAFALFAGSFGALINSVADRADFDEPGEIRAAAFGYAAESEWGWLVTDILIEQIEGPTVGAFVRNNPPDGVITIDLRPWNDDRLHELVDHEIGHLLDFAMWEPADPFRNGGIGVEAWAECAAVFAGTRGIDGTNADEQYHCRADDLATFEAEIALSLIHI